MEEQYDEVEEHVEEPEQVAEETEPTSEEPEHAEEVEEEPAPEPKTVPLDALQDERRKRQELEQKLDQIQRGVEDLKVEQKPKDIYEAFDRDPKGVTGELNTEIKRLVDDDAYGNASQIERLRDLKDELRLREFKRMQENLNTTNVKQQTIAKVAQAIPDIVEKERKLMEFAVQELDYSVDEIVRRVNPANGDDAVREMLRINKLYDKFHAKPAKKAVKPKPTSVESGGKGVQKSEPNLEQLMERAQQTGNWQEYFEAKGLL